MQYKVHYRNVFVFLGLLVLGGLCYWVSQLPDSDPSTEANTNGQAPDLQGHTTDNGMPANTRTNYWSEQQLKVKDMLFYETGSTALSRGKRQYSTVFFQPEARYISWELSLTHPPLPKDTTVQVQYAYYDEHGALIGKYQTGIALNRQTTATFANMGWGWAEEGNWQAGKYEVSISFADSVVAKGGFAIANIQQYLQAPRALYYGNTAEATLEYNSRAYRRQFDRKTTRAIGWEFHYDLPIALRQPMKYFIEAKCFKPSGGEIDCFFNPSVPKDLTHTWAHDKWTWDTPDLWEAGKYTTEFWMNKSLVLVDSFTIRR